MNAITQALQIKKAIHVGGYKLKLVFSDGKEQIVNFEPFLENSLHPEIRKYLQPKIFKNFTIENGDLMWGDFDLIFPIIDLYENQLDRGKKETRKPNTKTNNL